MRVCRISHNTWFGPVHVLLRQSKGDTGHGYVTVCVPSCVVPDLLVWVNVSQGSQLFARHVEGAKFEAQGWTNRFLFFVA